MSSLPAAVSTVVPEAFNIADYLVARHVREGHGSRIALMTPDGPISYGELDALVNRAGNALRALGLAPGTARRPAHARRERLLRGLPRRHQDWRGPDSDQHAAPAG